jgi:acetyl-CoA carboxylase biotin carboxyl carrier protein
MDLDAVFRLMDRAEKSSFNKIEIQYQDLRLCLERGSGPLSAAPAEAGLPEKAAEPDDDELIRSPIAGVFYLAKEPGAEPFVSVGSHVNKGDTVCIIEAMKTMNEISTPLTGVIASMLVKDGQTVAAGDVLFRLAGGK